ncbi:MAG: peroxiredoxin, partial [Thermoplasmata archaeon]
MIGVGDLAPSFTGTTQEGAPIDSTTFRGKPLVLYFYPKANTSGCAMEARGFAQSYPTLEKAGIAVVGVSVDTVADQKRFAESCGVPFPLVADRDKEIAKRYGVLGLLGIAKRVTFFIGPDGRVTEVVQGMMPGHHVRRAVERARSPS